MYAILILCLVTLVDVSSSAEECTADSNKEWSYHYPPTDPSQWSTLFKGCGSKTQSPIDIDTNTAMSSPYLYLVVNYDPPITSATMRNTGSTIEITPTDDGLRNISMNGVEYNLEQFHFHWGCGETDSPGSEHTLDGEQYDMEIHFVHKEEEYGSMAVIGVFVEVDSSNSVFQTISDALGNVKTDGAETEIQDLDISALIPDDGASVYYYSGSLTTPTCQSYVNWFVFPDSIEISDEQYAPFHEIYTVMDEDPDCKMDGNFRPTQPSNGRRVYKGTLIKGPLQY